MGILPHFRRRDHRDLTSFRYRHGVRRASAVYCQTSGEETLMALMLGKLYDALRAGGAPDDPQ
jgi:hypothetical protein